MNDKRQETAAGADIAKSLRGALIAPTLGARRSIRRALDKRARESNCAPFREKRAIADAFPFSSSGPFALVGPTLGAPATALAAEVLIRRGAARLLLIGTVGGLALARSNIAVGDIILPTGAVSEEGTSRCYNISEPRLPTSELSTSFAARVCTSAERLQLRLHQGLVWTTDAPMLETHEKARAFSLRGAIAVDMEFCSLLAVALHRRVQLAAAFVVSDLWTEGWSGIAPGKGYRRALDLLSQCAVDALFSEDVP